MIPTQKAILAKSVRATADALVIETDLGQFEIPWSACSPRLARATQQQRTHLSLSPSGYGVHWPMIDEDLTIKGLIRTRHVK